MTKSSRRVLFFPVFVSCTNEKRAPSAEPATRLDGTRTLLKKAMAPLVQSWRSPTLIEMGHDEVGTSASAADEGMKEDVMAMDAIEWTANAAEMLDATIVKKTSDENSDQS